MEHIRTTKVGGRARGPGRLGGVPGQVREERRRPWLSTVLANTDCFNFWGFGTSLRKTRRPPVSGGSGRAGRVPLNDALAPGSPLGPRPRIAVRSRGEGLAPSFVSLRETLILRSLKNGRKHQKITKLFFFSSHV